MSQMDVLEEGVGAIGAEKDFQTVVDEVAERHNYAVVFPPLKYELPASFDFEKLASICPDRKFAGQFVESVISHLNQPLVFDKHKKDTHSRREEHKKISLEYGDEVFHYFDRNKFAFMYVNGIAPIRWLLKDEISENLVNLDVQNRDLIDLAKRTIAHLADSSLDKVNDQDNNDAHIISKIENVARATKFYVGFINLFCSPNDQLAVQEEVIPDDILEELTMSDNLQEKPDGATEEKAS